MTKPKMLDLDQFRDLDDALDQLANSRVYDDVLMAAFARPHTYSVLTVFAQSSCTRLRGLHEGIVREVAASNPHAAFPLNRAFAETVLTVAYAHDHPDYVDRIMERRGDQPKELKRLQIKRSSTTSHPTLRASATSTTSCAKSPTSAQ